MVADGNLSGRGVSLPNSEDCDDSAPRREMLMCSRILG